MPRYLGIDYGHKRIGLAVSDAEGRQACPLQQLDNSGDAQQVAHRLQPVIEDYEIDRIVIGLPLNMDDSEGPQAKLTRIFGDAISRLLATPVIYWDERLSSYAADQLLNQREELTSAKRRQRRDALAAAAMLQAYLDRQPPSFEQTAGAT